MDSISDVVTRAARDSSRSESSRTEASFRGEAKSVKSRKEILGKAPSMASRLSAGSRVKVVKPQSQKSVKSQHSSVKKPGTLKSSDLGL